MAYKGFRFDVLARKMGFDALEVGYGFSINTSLDRGEDEDTDFVRAVEVTLYGRNRDDDHEVTREVVLGEFVFWHFLGDYAFAVGADIVDEADAISQDLYEAAVVLYGASPEPIQPTMLRGGLVGAVQVPRHELRGGLVDRFNTLNETTALDALYLYRMYLRPDARGYGLSEAIIQRAIEQITGGRVACVLANPMVGWHNGVREGDPLHGRDAKEGQGALELLFNQMGFMPVEGWPRYVAYDGYFPDWRRNRWSGRSASEARKVRDRKLVVVKAA